MFPSVLFNLNWKRYISNFWKKKKNTWLQRDISCLTPHRQTYQSFSLSVVISVPVSAADSWETRQQPFQKVTSQHSTSSLSFTPLTAPPPPPPLQSLCLFLWMLTMAFSVGKWLRLKECESVCDFVCVPLRTVTGCQGRRERENLTKWQQDRISVSHCDRVGVTKPGVTVEKEGGREKKKLLLLQVPQPLWRFSFVKNSNPFFFY